MMKPLKLVWVFVLMPLLAFSQDENVPTVFENFYFTVMNGHAAKLEAAMSAHNKKYHPEGLYQAQVYSVMNGPNAGKLVWSMGPSTWSAHENRPQQEGHDEDWDENISVHIDSYGATDYFQMDTDLSYFPAAFDLKRLRLWMVDLEDGANDRFQAFMKRIVKVNSANNSEVPMGVYQRQFAGTNPPDVGIVWFFDSLEWFEQPGEFAGWYEAMYGEGSMELLIEEWEDMVKAMDVEIWTFIPEMSGHDGAAVDRTGN